MSEDSLRSRVGQLLRGERHLPAPLSEREVRDAMRPERHHHQVIAVSSVSPPQVISLLTNAHPSAPEPDGVRGELLVHEDSTG